ncbi:MAG: ABC transporter permease [Chloroflexi bacterium]|nr:MAG: ABC transporter permease [Chloroflexota bacterium]
MTTLSLAPLTGLPDGAAVRVLSPGQLAWQRFRRHKMAMAGLIVLAGLFVYVFAAGAVLSRGMCAPLGRELSGEAFANCNDTGIKLQAPSAAHPFGTDTIGQDILARTIYGGQISLLIGVSAALIEVILGTIVGSIAAYYGGWVDNVLMRFTEAMLNIPSLFLLIVAAKFLGGTIPELTLLGRTFSSSVVVIIVIIGFTSWMYLARIVRANILSLKEQDFISASRCLGVSNARMIVTHLLPNTLAPVIVTATLGIANAILSEAYVSFLGLGVKPPTASWGNMLENSYRYLESAPWLWVFPGLFVLITVLGVNFVGDGLRDALDPRSTRAL